MRKPFAHQQGRQPITWCWLWRIVFTTFSIAVVLPLRADHTNLIDEVRLLREQNALLQQQVKSQGALLDTLIQKVNSLEAARPIEGGNDRPLAAGRLEKLHIGGEGGAGYAATGPEGYAPSGKFQLNDARLFLEAPVYDDVYFYGEVVLADSSQYDNRLQLGELYAEFENISKLWNKHNQLNARVGQMYIPFGEDQRSITGIAVSVGSSITSVLI